MAAITKSKEPSQKKWLKVYVRFSGIAIQMAALILAGTWLGKKADESWGTEPWMLTTGALLAFGIAIYLLFSAIPRK